MVNTEGITLTPWLRCNAGVAGIVKPDPMIHTQQLLSVANSLVPVCGRATDRSSVWIMQNMLRVSYMSGLVIGWNKYTEEAREKL